MGEVDDRRLICRNAKFDPQGHWLNGITDFNIEIARKAFFPIQAEIDELNNYLLVFSIFFDVETVPKGVGNPQKTPMHAVCFGFIFGYFVGLTIQFKFSKCQDTADSTHSAAQIGIIIGEIILRSLVAVMDVRNIPISVRHSYSNDRGANIGETH